MEYISKKVAAYGQFVLVKLRWQILCMNDIMLDIYCLYLLCVFLS